MRIVQKAFSNLGIILLSSLIFSCATTSLTETTHSVDAVTVEKLITFPEMDYQLFGAAPSIEQPEDILFLSTEQLAEFKAYSEGFSNRKYKSHEHVFRYLQNMSSDFTYENKTFTADVTLENGAGNCMSLAVLTAALAKTLDVKIQYQLVNRIPVYQEYGNIVFNARHIKTALFEPLQRGNEGAQLYRSYAVVDYYPSKYNYVDGIVDEEGFFAMYYRNRSAETLGEGDYSKSFYYLMESLKFEPEHEEAINNLAVLHRRMGQEAKAEELYLYGIRKAKNKVTLLRNYKALLHLQERTDEVAKIQNELDQYEEENPFVWITAGNEAFSESAYIEAKKMYQKALKTAPYLHQAHFGIAKAEYMLGNPLATKRALNAALGEVFDEKSRSLYEAKLEALNRERFN